MSDLQSGLLGVRPVDLRHNRRSALVVCHAVTWRKVDQHVARLGDRPRVDHDDPRMHVAKIDHLAGAVGVDCPQVMELDLAPVHVLPARVQDPSIGQHGRSVVVFRIVRNSLNVAAIGVAPMQHTDLRLPAIDPALAASRNKNNAAVRQVAGLVVIKLTRRQLCQTRSVQVDLVKVIEIRVSFAVRKEHLLRVVVDRRIAHGAALGIEQHRHLATLQIQFAELADPRLAVARVGLVVLVVAEIADVGVPVRVVVGKSDDKHHLPSFPQRALQCRVAQRWLRGGKDRGLRQEWGQTQTEKKHPCRVPTVHENDPYCGGLGSRSGRWERQGRMHATSLS